MAYALIVKPKKFVGLSTDTKPTGVGSGSSFWERDTNILWKTYDGTNWVVFEVKSLSLTGSIDLQQAANTYDLFTGTTGAVVVTYFKITLPNVNVSDDANITSIAVVTDTATVITLLSAAAGAKANLVANASFSYATPFTLPATKKIRLTIAGGAADAPTVCTTLVRYQAINPAGYLA